MPADTQSPATVIVASPDEAAALKAAGVALRPIAPAEDLGPGQAAESAPAADPAAGRGNQAEQSGTPPPPDPKRAAIQPLVDRVRTIDCWFVAKGESPKHRASTPITDALLANHLNGKGVRVGACPMERGSSTTRLALLDLDDHDKKMKWADVVDIARDLAAAAKERGVELVPFRSSGGRGMHLYAIWDEQQDARSARISLDGVLTDCGYAPGTKGLQMNQVEVFPKQDQVPADGWGNMFVLPGSRESAPIDLATGEVVGWDQVAWSISAPVPSAPPDTRPVAPAAPAGDADFARVRSALMHLDPNEFDYDQWIRLVMAVSHGTNGSAAGHALIHEWSSQFARYDPVETDKQWNWATPDKAGGITVNWLFATARKREWQDPTLSDGFEVIADEPAPMSPAEVEAERVRLYEVFLQGEGTEADARALAALPDDVQRDLIDRLAMIHDDAERRARAALKKADVSSAAVVAKPIDAEMTDAGNVAVLIHLQKGNLRYDPSTDTFISWVNGRWERDEDGTRVREAIKQVARYWETQAERTRAAAAAAGEVESGGAREGAGRPRADGFIPGGKAAKLKDLADKQAGWAKACGNLKQINAIKTLAKVEKSIVVDPATLDRNRYLLGVENGVVDLRTGKLHADARDEFVTRRCPVRFDPDAKAPRWLQFQDEIAGLPAAEGAQGYTPRPGLVAFKQRWAGSMLIGENVGQKFFTATGEGSNGKSLEVETYVGVMGPLAVKLPQGAFMAGPRGSRDADAASPMLASLHGVRLALASETEAGNKLNTGDVKAVTGDDEIRARKLHANSVQFRLEATVVLLTNHPPTIQTVDNAIAGRLMIVPYERTWNRPDDVGHDPDRPDADPGLKAALRAEQEGILAWMVQGAVQVLAAGGRLDPPREVTEKTDRYLQQQSVFGQWFETLEVVGQGTEADAKVGGTAAQALFEDFRRHARGTGGSAPEAGSVKAFGTALQRICERRGVAKGKNREGTRYALRISTGNPLGPTFNDLF